MEKQTRKNVGVTGRGDTLSHEQKQRIKDMAKYYPNIDFTALGI